MSIGRDGFKQTWASGLLVPGPPGEPGPPGPLGPRGFPGQDGPQGVRGPQGDPGVQGPGGNDGVAGPPGPPGQRGGVGPMGPRGLTGDTGPQGDQGIPGATGPQGEGLQINGTVTDPSQLPSFANEGAVFFSESDQRIYIFSGGSWIDGGPVAGVPGPQGDPGVQGDPGPPGGQGPPGSPGATGATGPQGPPGADGVSMTLSPGNLTGAVTLAGGANISITQSGQTITIDSTAVAGVASVFGRTGPVVAAAGDYTAAQVTNAVNAAAGYANPAWLTSLAWSKITGAPAFLTAAVTAISPGNLSGAVTLAAGANMSVTQSGQTITISSSAAGQTPWAQDINASGYRLYNTGRVLIGTSTDDGSSMLQVYKTTVLTAALVSNGGTSAGVTATCYSGSTANYGGQYFGYAARGTQAAPTATQTGDWLADFRGYGYGGSAFINAAEILFLAAANFAANAPSSQILFSTSNAGPTTERMRITPSGQVGIGTSSPAANVLDVRGPSPGAYGQALIKSTDTNCWLNLDTTGTGGQAGLEYYNNGGWVGEISYTVAQGLRFYTASMPHVIVISPTGNMGIGTASPQQNLTVTSGDSAVVNIYTAGGVGRIDCVDPTTPSTNRWLYINPTGAPIAVGNSPPVVKFHVQGGVLGCGASCYASPNAGDISCSRDSAPTTGVVYFGSGGTQYIWFNGSQWVFNPPLPTTTSWNTYAVTVNDDSGAVPLNSQQGWYRVDGNFLLLHLIINPARNFANNAYFNLPQAVINGFTWLTLQGPGITAQSVTINSNMLYTGTIAGIGNQVNYYAATLRIS